MTIAMTLHLLAALIWVGGMFFAYNALRPVAVQVLESEQRVRLWHGVLQRFFNWVWVCVVVLLITGLVMIHLLGGMGGITNVGIHVHIMLLLGIFMMLLFMHVYFNPFKKLKWSVAEHDWIAGAEAIGHIRKSVLLNLTIGLIVVVVAVAGHYLLA